ncbi:MAG TPA: hypothetical protein VGL81_36415 [Polyangiaceae bacterium]
MVKKAAPSALAGHSPKRKPTKIADVQTRRVAEAVQALDHLLEELDWDTKVIIASRAVTKLLFGRGGWARSKDKAAAIAIEAIKALGDADSKAAVRVARLYDHLDEERRAAEEREVRHAAGAAVHASKREERRAIATAFVEEMASLTGENLLPAAQYPDEVANVLHRWSDKPNRRLGEVTTAGVLAQIRQLAGQPGSARAILQPDSRKQVASCYQGRIVMKRLTRRARAHFMRRAQYEARHLRRGAVEDSWRLGRRRSERIVLVGNLDLIDNPEETRLQLQNLDRLVIGARGERLRVFVDLSGVVDVDPSAVLYIAAQLDTLRQRGSRVSGNYPHAENARKTLRDARFEIFMGSSAERLGPPTPGVPEIEIRTGDRSIGLRPRDWTPLHRFIKKHGALTDEGAEAAYIAFGECVENVVQHAYRGRRGRWYALAIRPSDTGPARAVVLDLGIGIPRSIRRNFTDSLHSILGAGVHQLRTVLELDDEEEKGDEVLEKLRVWLGDYLRRLEAFDWSCVHLATLGKRTETGEVKRGKGLSVLRKAVLNEKSGALHVLSGHAAVTWAHGVPPRENNLAHLRGTIVCLEFGSEKPAGAHDG